MVSDRVAQQRENIHFRVLRLLERQPQATQREIAEQLDMSLGAVNYCVSALLNKGHVKLANFKASKNKLGYVYVLTQDGIAHRASLAVRFIDRKMAEYEAIRAELDQLQVEFSEFLSVAQE